MGAFHRFISTAAILAASCGGGCSATPGPERNAGATGALTELNGVMFNGVMFNGTELDPLQFDALSLGGQPLTGVTLDGSVLTGLLPGGGPVSGGSLVGAEIAGTLSNGDALTVRIDGITAGSAPDVQLYNVSARAGSSDPFTPLCAAEDGSPVAAMALSGSWDLSEGTPSGGSHVDDPSTFTFACEGYALAKCVDLGYAPWRNMTECKTQGDCATRSLAPFHEACTRMLRADYCGDGTPTTRDGTQVDVWDLFGLQTDDQPTWNLEAEWGSDGAVCVERTRWATGPDGEDVATYIHDHCPTRWQTPGCGGSGSTFFTATGFDVPLDTRALLRDRNDHP